MLQGAVAAVSTEVTVTGTGFGTTQADLTVTAGGYDCVVTAVSDTEFTCTLGAVPAGVHELQVKVAGKGGCGVIAATQTARLEAI